MAVPTQVGYITFQVFSQLIIFIAGKLNSFLFPHSTSCSPRTWHHRFVTFAFFPPFLRHFTGISKISFVPYNEVQRWRLHQNESSNGICCILILNTPGPRTCWRPANALVKLKTIDVVDGLTFWQLASWTMTVIAKLRIDCDPKLLNLKKSSYLFVKDSCCSVRTLKMLNCENKKVYTSSVKEYS